MYRELGDFQEATRLIKLAIAQSKQLVAEHPSIAKYQHDLAQSYNNLAAVLGDTGRLERDAHDDRLMTT